MKQTVKNIIVTTLIFSLMIGCNCSNAMKKLDMKRYDTSWIFNKKNKNTIRKEKFIKKINPEKESKIGYLFQLKYKDGEQQSYTVEIDEQNKKCKIKKANGFKELNLGKPLNPKGKVIKELENFILHTYPELISVSNEEYNDIICSMLGGDFLTIKGLGRNYAPSPSKVNTNKESDKSKPQKISDKERRTQTEESIPSKEKLVFKKKMVESPLPKCYQYLIFRKDFKRHYILDYFPEEKSAKILQITASDARYLSDNNYLKPTDSTEKDYFQKMPSWETLQNATKKFGFSFLDEDVRLCSIVGALPNKLEGSRQYLNDNQKRENLEGSKKHCFEKVSEEKYLVNDSNQEINCYGASGYIFDSDSIGVSYISADESEESGSLHSAETRKDELLYRELLYREEDIPDDFKEENDTTLKIKTINLKLPSSGKFCSKANETKQKKNTGSQNMLKNKNLNLFKF